jgi:hypothetical protein
LIYRLLRSEELCHGEEQGASGCPLAETVKCVTCEFEWRPESNDVNAPGRCPSCDQFASVAQRCPTCPKVEVDYYREATVTGRLLERVLDHEFDAKHYRVDPGSVSVEVRTGLKTLESERSRWEKETREKAEQEREERRLVQEMQRKQRGGF